MFKEIVIMSPMALKKGLRIFFSLSVFVLTITDLCSCQVPQNEVLDTAQPSSKDSAEPVDPISLIDSTLLPAADQPCREPILVDVDYVIDGDTFNAQGSVREERVRVIGVNTPELGYDGDQDECYAQEAKSKLEDLIAHRKVWLTFDQTCVDFYDRTLAYVHVGLAEQDFVQRTLLRQGFGRAFPFEDTPAFQDLFEADESIAQQNNSGGWEACSW
ncbi:MAG: hypothetical protein CMK59_02895 [Proteobacteria bacterium]|nr:hypothetical protein [Pseudomonadota bacterium]